MDHAILYRIEQTKAPGQNARSPYLPALLAELDFDSARLLLVQHKHDHAILARLVVLVQQLVDALVAPLRVYHFHNLKGDTRLG